MKPTPLDTKFLEPARPLAGGPGSADHFLLAPAALHSHDAGHGSVDALHHSNAVQDIEVHVSSTTLARRGRPPIMTREILIARIRELAASDGGLFRIHRAHPEVYARARRMFGSWSEAVRSAGVDYDAAVRSARRRSRDAVRIRASIVDKF